jgi:arylsulfatase A-like enzyme
VAPDGLARGFETYIDSTSTMGYNLAATRIGRDFIAPGTERWFHRSRFNQFNAHELNEQAYDWFDHRSERPFFLFVQYNDAHDPYEVPSPYDHLYGQMSAETKAHLQEAKMGRFDFTADERKSLADAYDNTLRYQDSQVGELLQHLKDSPQWSNTYVIITADHGEAFGEHSTYSHGWDLYREVLHVPLVVVGPGVPAGVRITDTARTRQILATALEFAGDKADIVRESSLSRLWKPGYKPNDADEPTVSEVIDPTPPPEPPGMISITTQEWHFIWYAGAHRSRLYHWPTDPTEQQNVAELPENQALVEHLKNSILSIVGRSYRPWRDTRYLLAVSDPGSPFNIYANPAAQQTPGSRLPLGPGAVQTLFPQNPESPQNHVRNPDEDLLRSLPYGNEP